MGIEPTHQLVTGALVLKGIKHRKTRFSQNPGIFRQFIDYQGFPGFSYVGMYRGLPDTSARP
jgi:hypothetical protein